MNEFKKLLTLEEEKLNWKVVLFLILIAYIFNVALRYIYISYVGDIPQFQWQEHLMINNNDGYFWAEGARDILAGFHQPNDLSPIHAPASILTAAIAKFLPFLNFDVLIEYLPGFLGSLVVIPTLLIGRMLGSTWFGFLASLMSGMVWSYYHRTMFGYYDTDMLVVTLPVFAVWAIMWSLKNQNKIWFFLAPLIEIFMIYWHSGLFNVANGFFIMATIYVIFFSRNKSNILFLVLLIIPMLKVAFVYKLTILTLVYFGILKSDKFDKNINIKYLLSITIVLYIVIIGLPWMLQTMNAGYFTRAITNTTEGFKYFSVVNTVSEASHIDFNVLVHRISGSWLGFIFGAIGYILLLIRYPIMMITLPMVVLGLFAIRGGLRFTIFAVPFFALGDAYIVYLIGKLSKKLFIKDNIAKISKYLLSFILMIGFIYPNYKHMFEYLVPTVFNKNVVEVLDKLKHIASRDDYVLSWWDYGYPIRYYADVKTLIDGGKHVGSVNFPVSFALTRDLLASRNMAVLDVYQTEYNYKHNIDDSDYLKFMMKRYGFTDPNEFLSYLDMKIKLPKIKENIYYFLPIKMFNILPVVAEFSNIDLNTGEQTKHFYYTASNGIEHNNIIDLHHGIRLDLSRALVLIGNQAVPIKRFAVTEYTKDGKLHKNIQTLRKQGLNVVYMKSYNRWLILDDFYFNSAFIQLFVFENTGGLFEPVIITPFAKVYKVRK